MNTDKTSELSALFTYDRNGEKLIKVKEQKESSVLEVPVDEIESYPYLIVNKYRYSVILTDIDEPRTGDKEEGCDPYFFEGLGLPIPNTVTMTTRGYHAIWSLLYPVAKNGKGLSYYRHVRTTYNAATNGDFSCAATCATRNPLYHGADSVIFGNWRYELAKLDIPFKGNRPGFRVPSKDYVDGNRNTATFLYALAAFKACPDADFGRMMAYVESWQAEQKATPLPRSENRGIVASVLRNGGRYQFTGGNPNRGRLALPKREGFLPLDEFRVWKAEHQAIGAEYARSCLIQNTEARVQAAVDSLQGKVTIKGVARLAGVSKNTAKKYLYGGGQSAVSRIVT